MPSLGVAIMGHPERESWVRQTAQKLDDKGLVVAWDTNRTVYDTGRRAWLEGVSSDQYTHWLVLQDDALIPYDLISGVESALEYVDPQSPLSLYLGTSRPFNDYVTALTDRANFSRTSFIVTTKLNWGVAVVVPTAQIPTMIDYADKRGSPRYDVRLSTFFQVNKIPVWYTWPCLVDHRPGESLMGHRDDNRQARRFIGQNESALGVNWSGGVVKIPWTSNRKVP